MALTKTVLLRRMTVGRGLSVASVALLFSASAAQASPRFPGIVQAELEMSCAPKCSICHTENPGSYGTETQPFADTLGVNAPVDDEELREAVKKLNASATQNDSDNNGTGDIDELKALTDPNVAGDGEGSEVCVPQYGCGAASFARAPVTQPFESVWLLAALGSWLVVRRARHVKHG